jgi:hypothetical protein
MPIPHREPPLAIAELASDRGGEKFATFSTPRLIQSAR